MIQKHVSTKKLYHFKKIKNIILILFIKDLFKLLELIVQDYLLIIKYKLVYSKYKLVFFMLSIQLFNLKSLDMVNMAKYVNCILIIKIKWLSKELDFCLEKIQNIKILNYMININIIFKKPQQSILFIKSALL